MVIHAWVSAHQEFSGTYHIMILENCGLGAGEVKHSAYFGIKQGGLPEISRMLEWIRGKMIVCYKELPVGESMKQLMDFPDVLTLSWFEERRNG